MTDPRAWRGIGVLAVVAIVVQLYGLYRVTGPPAPPWFPHADKLEHAAGFALPVALVLTALRRRAAGRATTTAARTAPLVAAAFAGHAVLSEVVQHAFYTHRTGDPWDVLADWVGVAVGLLAGRPVPRVVAHRGALP